MNSGLSTSVNFKSSDCVKLTTSPYGASDYVDSYYKICMTNSCGFSDDVDGFDGSESAGAIAGAVIGCLCCWILLLVVGRIITKRKSGDGSATVTAELTPTPSNVTPE